MLAIGSAATCTVFAKVCLIVCIAAYHHLGMCATTVPEESRSPNQWNQTEGPGLPAIQSKIIGSPQAVYDWGIRKGAKRAKTDAASLKRFRYNAMIQIIYNGTNQPVGAVCTGALISRNDVIPERYIERIVVTAGVHALKVNTYSEGTGALAGTSTITDQPGSVVKAKSWKTPDEFFDLAKGMEREWDVCVIRLEDEIKSPTATVDMYFKDEGKIVNELKDGSEMHTFGWGSQLDSNPHQPSENLRGLVTSTVSCEGSIFASPNFICTRATKMGAVCRGDDGGPLVRMVHSPSKGPNYKNIVGVYADKSPKDYYSCLSPTDDVAGSSGEGDLVAYVNTMFPPIYKFIQSAMHSER